MKNAESRIINDLEYTYVYVQKMFMYVYLSCWGSEKSPIRVAVWFSQMTDISDLEWNLIWIIEIKVNKSTLIVSWNKAEWPQGLFRLTFEVYLTSNSFVYKMEYQKETQNHFRQIFLSIFIQWIFTRIIFGRSNKSWKC